MTVPSEIVKVSCAKVGFVGVLLKPKDYGYLDVPLEVRING